MAASAIEPEHNRTAGTDRSRSSKQHRRRLLSHLHIQVPVPTSSGWSGRPSGPASAPCDAHASASASAHHHHQDRPASPSLLRSPTAWIRSKSHGFGSGKHHTPRRPAGNFHYDARSYAQNFDEGGGREEDALKQHRYLSLGLLASPRQVSPSSPSNQGTSGGGSSNGVELPAQERLRVME